MTKLKRDKSKSVSRKRVRRGKSKGRRLQKLIAQTISDITGIVCGKDREIESREMGQAGTDIKLYGKAKELFPYAIECKNSESWSLKNYIEQSRENCNDSWESWLLFMAKNHFKPIVFMEEHLFYKLFPDSGLSEIVLTNLKQWKLDRNVNKLRKDKNIVDFVIFVSNKEESFAVMDMEVFFNLYKKRWLYETAS